MLLMSSEKHYLTMRKRHLPRKKRKKSESASEPLVISIESDNMIDPHGGKLVKRLDFRESARKETEKLKKKEVSLDKYRDLANIAHGLFSPLDGYMNENDFNAVLRNGRLENDLPWTIPIVMDFSREEGANIREGERIALAYEGEPVGLLDVEDIYGYDKANYARSVFGTDSIEHPGVKRLFSMGEKLVGGKITLLKDPPTKFPNYKLWPEETRVLFREKGWKKIVGFQTRNTPHIGHEYVQKASLTLVDGLLINPLIGKKKKGDFKDETIIKAYEALFNEYYPENTATMSIIETEMRYAGPKEAIFHAIMRKNLGCTHFIVGRDHAGVGNFYGPFDSHKIFLEYPDLVIEPIFFRSFYYCKKCRSVVNDKICPHGKEYQINFSGTAIRQMLVEGKRPPEDMMRPEVADAILSFENPLVE